MGAVVADVFAAAAAAVAVVAAAGGRRLAVMRTHLRRRHLRLGRHRCEPPGRFAERSV